LRDVSVILAKQAYCPGNGSGYETDGTWVTSVNQGNIPEGVTNRNDVPTDKEENG
jgi:hypothetical protein